MAYNEPLVIDTGTSSIKAGLAGGQEPTLHFPAYVGRPKHHQVMTTLEGDYHVGSKASELRGILQLQSASSHGIVQNWADIEKLWSSVYKNLSVVQDQHPVLLTEAPLNPRQNRSKSAEVFFETFNIPALYVQTTSILSLYASGRVTGCVVDSGDGVSCVVPVFQGFAAQHAVQRHDLAGRDVSEYLQILLRKLGANFHTSAEAEIVRDIKEKCCYVAADIQSAEADKDPNMDYQLPDGKVVQLGKERFRAPELLFRPSLVGSECDSLPEALVSAISKCDLHVRKELYSEIILSGGTTMTQGFGERLLTETRNLAPKDIVIKIWAPAKRTLSAWVGGSILASLTSFKGQMLISRKAYAEFGSSAIFRNMI